jgi:hypothetical protein
MLEFLPFLAYGQLVPNWLLAVMGVMTLFLGWLLYFPNKHIQVKPMKASRFRADLVPQDIDTIVIGSGSGGRLREIIHQIYVKWILQRMSYQILFCFNIRLRMCKSSSSSGSACFNSRAA